MEADRLKFQQQLQSMEEKISSLKDELEAERNRNKEADKKLDDAFEQVRGA